MDLKQTADIIAGYKTGSLVIESGIVSLQDDAGKLTVLTKRDYIEVRNGCLYEPITLSHALAAVTPEDWPLYGGMYARVKSTS